MMFTSGTQERDGRTVNYDPKPWHERETDRRYSDREVIEANRAGRCWLGLALDFRPEFAVLDNPILAEFRKIKNKYGTVADSARWCLENGVWRPDSSLLGGPDVVHAQRVLTRLANLERGTK